MTYVPLMTDQGFLCNTCNRSLPLALWVRESRGQCARCWDKNPDKDLGPRMTFFDINKRGIKNED
jgi:hypothetical protein